MSRKFSCLQGRIPVDKAIFTRLFHGSFRQFSKIGFVGLGNMGAPMARNLIKKNHKVSIYDVDAEKRSTLVADGAEEASTLKEVSANAEFVITMLPADQHVQDVYTSQDGILKSVPPGCLLIDCSTIHFQIAKDIARLSEEAGAKFIEAPVSGGVLAAKEGRLSFMAGGHEVDVEKARPILNSMGAKVIHCGPHGSGQVVKMCNNMLLAISMTGVSEAMNLGIKLGLEAKKLAEVINSSTGKCWSSEVYNPVPGVVDGVPSSKDYEGGFSVALMLKDLGLAEKVAGSNAVEIPLGSKAKELYKTLYDQGLSNKDFSVIFKYLNSLKHHQ